MNEDYVRYLKGFMHPVGDRVYSAAIAYLCHRERQFIAARQHDVEQPAVSRLVRRIKWIDQAISVVMVHHDRVWTEAYVRGLSTFMHRQKKNVIDAVIEHACHGVGQTDAAKNHGVLQPTVARSYRRIKELDKMVLEAYRIRESSKQLSA